MEADAFDVAGFVEALLEFGEALDFAFRKNEAMVGGLPGDSFVFMQFEECGGIAEISLLALAAVLLDFAELAEVLLELAGEALAVEAEGGEEAVGVHDVECDGGIFIGRVGGARENVGFEQGSAVDAPGGVGEFLDELGFGGGGGLVFVGELGAVELVGSGVFGGQDGGAGGQAVGERVLRRTLFAGAGARAGRVLRIRAVDGGAVGFGVTELDGCWR